MVFAAGSSSRLNGDSSPCAGTVSAWLGVTGGTCCAESGIALTRNRRPDRIRMPNSLKAATDNLWLWGGGNCWSLPAVVGGDRVRQGGVRIDSGADDRLSRLDLVHIAVAGIPDFHRKLDPLGGSVLETELELHRHHRIAQIGQGHLAAAVRVELDRFNCLVERRTGIEETAPEPGKVPA